jgi:hypothetical protein
MIIAHIEGATRICGKAQGYLGLPLRDEVIDDKVNGEGTPAMVTAWTPTPEELAALNAGACVHVRILGSVPPPMMVLVGPAPEQPTADPRLSAATEQATGRYEFPYNRTFQAIAAATSVYAEGVGVNVSVKAFQEAFNNFPDARPLSEPQTSWQPIETAPKDGTLVLICGFGSEGYYVADAKWDGEWLLFHPDNDDHTEPSYNVSYWMPLPAPPSEVSRPHQRGGE